jgi:hypothetical protein
MILRIQNPKSSVEPQKRAPQKFDKGAAQIRNSDSGIFDN